MRTPSGPGPSPGTKPLVADLHVVKAHQRVLELPDTGGQLAHHLVSAQQDLSLKDNFTVACATWQARTLAGIVGLDLGAPDSGFAHPIDPGALSNPEHLLRKQTFDFAIGLHPDKGGPLQADEKLAIWYPSAKILLV